MGLNEPTRPLPAYTAPTVDEPTVLLPAVASTTPAAPKPASRVVRGWEGLAGLLSSGLVVLTVVLLVAKLVAPLVVDGATGPQWWRIGVAAAVAVPAELLRIGRTRRPPWLRAVVSTVVVGAVIGVLALTWWW